jgi:large-conductance mechanosensitive channel
MGIFLAYPLPEEGINLLKIGERINIRYFELLGVIINFIIVQFIVVFYSTIDIALALDKQVGQHVLLVDLL